MPESILTILKFCFLALLYLFLARIVRVIYLELGGSRGGTARGQRAFEAATRRKGAGPARLRVIEPAEQRGRTYDIEGELTVGRAPGCQIQISDDSYVSQLHARLFLTNGDPYVEDLGSTNGTYLNQRKIDAPLPLKRGDLLQIGRTVMEVAR